MAIRKNLATGALAGGLLLGSLTACSGNDLGASAGASAGTSSASLGASASADTGTAAASGSAGAVTCSGASCSVTLNSDGTTVTVLGTKLELADVTDGTATIGVGSKQVSCSQGDTVDAGPLKLTCSTVTEQKVTVTAHLG